MGKILKAIFWLGLVLLLAPQKPHLHQSLSAAPTIEQLIAGTDAGNTPADIGATATVAIAWAGIEKGLVRLKHDFALRRSEAASE